MPFPSGQLDFKDLGLSALDRFSAELAEHEWTAPELFGVQPQAGVIRADDCGALVLSGVKVSAVAADRIAFTQTAYYRHVPGCGVGVPIWALKG